MSDPELSALIKELEKARDNPPDHVLDLHNYGPWEEAFNKAIEIIKKRAKEL